MRVRLRFYAGLTVLGMLALRAPSASAQVGELQPGVRARVSAPAANVHRLTGVVIGRTTDSLSISTPNGAPIWIPLTAITVADVSHGRSVGRGVARGLLWGGGIGLALGITAGNSASKQECTGPTDKSLCDGVIKGGSAAGGIFGGLVFGALIGAVIPAERWERVTPPPRVSLRPSRGGAAAVVTVGF